jgi:hypothetical protein
MTLAHQSQKGKLTVRHLVDVRKGNDFAKFYLTDLEILELQKQGYSVSKND